MTSRLLTVDQASQAIEEHKTLLVAGEEEVLGKLPRGNWIGGTIPYFMTDDGGICSTDRVFSTELPPELVFKGIRWYGRKDLHCLYTDAQGNVAAFLLIPGMSPVHMDFALQAPELPEFGMSPLVGWVAGVHLNDLGERTPRVFSGLGKSSVEEAVVLHVSYKPIHTPVVDIVNLFEPGDGPVIEFPSSGFEATTCTVDGQRQLFCDYVTQHRIDTRLPLVADVGGAMVNVSFQNVLPKQHKVTFYAPVFEGFPYRVAKPVENYEKSFERAVRERRALPVAFSCNCILNYVYSSLEGKKLDRFPGPFTFGEIAYQLMNQTLVSLEVP